MKHALRLLALAPIALLAPTTFSLAQTATWNSDIASQLDASIPALLGFEGIPGAQVAVVINGQTVFSRAYGVKQVGSSAPVLTSTQFRLASVSKPITTTMMASIVDSGVVSWDTPARSVNASFALADATRTANTTLRNLVCNCLGIERRDAELLFNAIPNTPSSVYAGLKNLQFTSAAGTFTYSNNLVAAGGWLASAAASGSGSDLFASYGTQLRSRVLNPIGMTRTTDSDSAVVAGGDYARSHSLDLNFRQQLLPQLAESFTQDIIPAGGLWSTAEDMAKFLTVQINRGLAANGRRVASAQNLQLTWTPQVNIQTGFDYGLGWFITKYLGKDLIFHGGNTGGQTSNVAFMPNDGVAVVILSNGQSASAPATISNRALALIFGQVDNFTPNFYASVQQTRQAYQQANAATVAFTAAEGQTWSANYSNADLGAVSLSYEAGTGSLIFAAGEFSSRVGHYTGATDAFYGIFKEGPLGGAVLTLDTDASGRRSFTLYVADRAYPFNRV